MPAPTVSLWKLRHFTDNQLKQFIDTAAPTVPAIGKPLAMGKTLAIHSYSRYFDFLNDFVVQHAPWLWEACMATKRPSAVFFCGHAGLPEPRSMPNHKILEEIEISGIRVDRQSFPHRQSSSRCWSLWAWQLNQYIDMAAPTVLRHGSSNSLWAWQLQQSKDMAAPTVYRHGSSNSL